MRMSRSGTGRWLALLGAASALCSAILLAGSPQRASATGSGYVLSAFAGNGLDQPPTPGPATSSPLSLPSGVAVDAQGDVYIADSDNSDVEKVTPSGTLSVLVGNGNPGFPTPGPASSSELFGPQGIAVDSSGNLYIADIQATEVVKVSSTGTLSILAGNSSGGAPPTPGPASASSLGQPWGIAVDSAGNVYVADYSNQVIEKITPSGTLSIFAGTGTAGAPTPGPATASDLDYPTGLAVDSHGNLYVADSVNSMIEKITPSGTLSIVAGNGTSAAPIPGPATSSPLDNPFGVAVDAAGDIYISDTSNNEIEEITPAGTLSIIAGDGSPGPPTYGPATATTLWAPNDVAATPAGALYVADTSNSTIDLLVPPAPVLSTAATITGTTTVGETLTAGQGTWTNSPVLYSYVWEDCDSSGANCVPIVGATASTYTLASADAGHTIRVVVTATNGGGSADSTSAATATVAAPPAVPAATPVVTPTETPLVVTLPSNLFTIASASAQADGTIVVAVNVPGPGTVTLLATHEDISDASAAGAQLEPGHQRESLGRVTITTTAAGHVTVTLHPNAAGRRLVRRHHRLGWALNVAVWTSYTPSGGHTRNVKEIVHVFSAKRR
jgi:sugar lactone lactonase YvrE